MFCFVTKHFSKHPEYKCFVFFGQKTHTLIECMRKQKRRKKGRYGASFLFTSKKTCMRNLDVNNKDGIVELYNMLCYLIRTIAGYTSLLVKG